MDRLMIIVAGPALFLSALLTINELNLNLTILLFVHVLIRIYWGEQKRGNHRSAISRM